MKTRLSSSRWLPSLAVLEAVLQTVAANDVLKTTGFSTCMDDSQIKVTTLDIRYDRTTQQLNFDVAGTSAKEQNITAALYVTAYGKQVYQKDFNPCDKATKVEQLCPGKCLYSRWILSLPNLEVQFLQVHLQQKVYRMYHQHLPARSRLSHSMFLILKEGPRWN